MAEVSMPRLSDTMQEGTISHWIKKIGDEIKKGDILAEVETDKANMEVESYDTGILEKILVQEGETAPIGHAIAIIGSGQGASAADTQQKAQPTQATATSQPPTQISQAVAAPSSPAKSAANGGTNTSATSDGSRLKVSPLARRIAEEHGIDLGQVQGTGPGGRIVRDDLEDLLEKQRSASPPAQPAAQVATQPAVEQVAPAAAQATSADTEVIALSSMQKTVARRLTESKQTVPHFYVSNEIDMTDALALRQAFNSAAGEDGIKISVNDLIVKACALALEKHPEVNSSYKDGQFLRHQHINVGMAVDVPNGLVVPVIKDANIKGVRSIARESRQFIEKARANKLTVNDMSGGTFSVSNLGMMDVTQFSAVINPPEAAILAIGSTRKMFIPVDDQPVLRSIMSTTLSADHRVLYGATIARFLQEVKRLLQNPYSLLG
jgi:pyruvate dehydrogenase E2 component (dihydrolipoyllysine-residue acetyltransferase)